ncbi:phage terminase small subunit P27 family [Liquorilactobacillus uvarum]|uniref:phage terminase small subunit P27 family n=1 Tax=Liquorilactobacillus uvarum TaxID=303240 RepID=UPI00288BB8A2|nr:phage terminase small subunit P27 family [Liquorilactobacillus uvarum]
MLGRKIKLTTDKSDRKDQRDRTQRLIESTKNMGSLQVTPPRHLVGVARYTWTQIVPILNKQGWLKQTDKAIVEQLCIQVAMYRDAYEHIFVGKPNKDGKCKPEGIQTAVYGVVQDSSGKILDRPFIGYKANPAVKTIDGATAKIKTLSESLGMTPQARASLLKIDDNNKDSPSIEDMRKAFGA